jgi:hypothetical protein
MKSCTPALAGSDGFFATATATVPLISRRDVADGRFMVRAGIECTSRADLSIAIIIFAIN